MRAGVLGALTYLYPEELVVHTTVNFTSVSHADPRCAYPTRTVEADQADRCALTTALLALVTAHVVNGSYKGEETIKHALSLVSNYLIQRDPPLDYAAVVDLSDWLCAEDLSELDLDSGCVSWSLPRRLTSLRPVQAADLHLQSMRRRHLGSSASLHRPADLAGAALAARGPPTTLCASHHRGDHARRGCGRVWPLLDLVA